MRDSLGLGAEDAGAFHRDVDAEFLPRQLGRIALGGNLDFAVADADRVAIDGYGAGEAAMHGIEAQQMGVGLDRAEIVNADYFDVLAAGFRNRPQDIAANAAKSVDRDADCHAGFSLNSWRHPRGTGSTEGLRRIARFCRARTVKMRF